MWKLLRHTRRRIPIPPKYSKEKISFREKFNILAYMLQHTLTNHSNQPIHRSLAEWNRRSILHSLSFEHLRIAGLAPRGQTRHFCILNFSEVHEHTTSGIATSTINFNGWTNAGYTTIGWWRIWTSSISRSTSTSTGRWTCWPITPRWPVTIGWTSLRSIAYSRFHRITNTKLSTLIQKMSMINLLVDNLPVGRLRTITCTITITSTRCTWTWWTTCPIGPTSPTTIN